jgi:hypothetical protein
VPQQQITLLRGRRVPLARLAWYARMSSMLTPHARMQASA